jgi:DNA-binding transcriptional MerR regulator
MTVHNEIDIAEVVRRSGVPISTLHVWERHNLITPTGRSGLRRQYEDGILQRIAAIVLLQRGGFSLAEIADLLNNGMPGDDKTRIATKLVELHRRQDELTAAITGLEHALSCQQPSLMACPTFQTMLDDALPIKPT